MSIKLQNLIYSIADIKDILISHIKLLPPLETEILQAKDNNLLTKTMNNPCTRESIPFEIDVELMELSAYARSPHRNRTKPARSLHTLLLREVVGCRAVRF